MKALLTTTFVVGALLCGAGAAVAAPRVPIGPPEIAIPTAPPEPDPVPCAMKPIPCDKTVPPLEPELPTDIANPTDPAEPTEPTEEPEQPTDVANPTDVPDETSEPAAPPVTTTDQAPVGQPQDGPTGVPTPNRIDTGAGPADGETLLEWWPVTIPALALLALAAMGALQWIRRTERRPS